MEDPGTTGDDEIDRDLRDRLRRRYAQVADQIKTINTQLASPTMQVQPEPTRDDPTVLDQLPTITGADLDELPEHLLRALYEAFQLEVHYHHDQHAVTIRVTVQEGRIPDMQDAIERAANPTPGPAVEHPQPGNASSTDVSSTPNGEPRTWEHPGAGHAAAARIPDGGPGRRVTLEVCSPLPPRRGLA